jgi:hypothetical protein
MGLYSQREYSSMSLDSKLNSKGERQVRYHLAPKFVRPNIVQVAKVYLA